MSKIAFVFPGQGSQAVGMCKAFYETYPVVKDIFDAANEALHYDITKMIFEGPESDLRLTANTQPAILTASVACNAVLAQHGAKFDVAAGHSLGEYSALVACGAMKFEDAVLAVHKRGQFMQEAVPVGEGSMAAILGMDSDKLVEICQAVEKSLGQAVQGVNFNCPGQVVIAGTVDGVNQACAELKANGAKRAMVLPVSAPFHSTLMQPAADRLAEVLAAMDIKDVAVPVYANVTAKPVMSGAEIRELLVKQAASPVLWESSVRTMIADGVDTFVEVGPGKVLTGFTKKIDRALPALNVEDPASLEKTLAALGL